MADNLWCKAGVVYATPALLMGPDGWSPNLPADNPPVLAVRSPPQKRHAATGYAGSGNRPAQYS